MGADSEYNRKLYLSRLEKLHELEAELPGYCLSFLDDKELTSQINTVVSYAYDLITFFKFLAEKNPILSDNEKIKDIPLEILDQLTFEDINEFQRFLQGGVAFVRTADDEIARNGEILQAFSLFYGS